MIARIWRGTVRETDKDAYFEYLQKTGLKEYADTPGNRGVHTLRRILDGKCEFFLLTLWDSWDAIKAFAGPDYEKAVYYPKTRSFCSIAARKSSTSKCWNPDRENGGTGVSPVRRAGTPDAPPLVKVASPVASRPR